MLQTTNTKWARGLLGLIALLIVTAGPTLAQEKTKIESLNDLPRHTYKIDGKASALLKSDEQFAALAKQIRADIAGDLAKFELDDAATLQGWHSTLLSLDMLEGEYDAALKRVEIMRELEDKEASKIMTGIGTKALVDALRETQKPTSDPATQKLFEKKLAAAVKDLPWDKVQDNIEQAKGMCEVLSENLVMGMVQSQLDPVVAQAGELSYDLASSLVRMRYLLEMRLVLNDEIVRVYGDLIDRNRVEKNDIWPARDVTLKSGNCERVVIGIWDSGVDSEIFGAQMDRNAAEQPDGQDNDGNGYVDDLYGINFDLDGRRTAEPLYPLGDAADRIGQIMEHMKGFLDVQAAVDSEDASKLKRYLSSLSPEDIKGFMEDLSLAGSYMHGTHVAGIAAAGNPCAKLVAARNMFDFRSIPKPMTRAIAERHAQSYRDTAAYFKGRNVRVVNMSWGWTLKEIEDALEKNNVGESAEQRGEMAAEYLAILRQGLMDAIGGSPEILFVAAAGNDDNDVNFDETIPSSFDLPNMMIVGAVDQAGEPTSFTSSGRNVEVYANGFEVDSYIPGGQRMKSSGTSMASPNAANLAAKLIALKPSLTPAQTIALIKKGADRVDKEFSYLLMNPKRTVELLKQEQ